MKQQILKTMVTVLVALSSLSANAYDAKINGIYYNLIEKAKQAEVTYGDNKYIGDIVIPESVEYDGVNYAVTSIGQSAFDGCSGLTSVTIPNSVTSIGQSAFPGCSGLTSVTIPNSVTSIGDAAFYSCHGLTSVTIPNSVTSIGESAFNDCFGLTSVTIPNSVTEIGKFAFSGCSGLTSVTIPNSVSSIGYAAFSSCFGLTSVTIPNSVTEIGGDAFAGCRELISLTIPNSVTEIGDEAFQGCYFIRENFVNNSKLTSYDNWGATLCDEETEDGLLIDDNTVMKCREWATSVTIPNSVTSIGGGAFSGCSGLTSVTIPNSVTSIGGWAFRGCYGLTSVTIPNSVTSIGYAAFIDCPGLTSVAIPNSVTEIGEWAFRYCSGLTSMTISNSVTSIGRDAFYGCYFIRDNFVNNSTLTSDNNWGATLYDEENDDGLLIGDNIVVKCREWVTSVVIPNSITSIGDNAFVNCSGLTSVTIPNSVTSIGDGAFSECSGLTSVTIPNSVTSIGGWTFQGCYGLTSVTIPNSVTSIGGWAFQGCYGLTSVTIPNSVTSIGESAFSSCGNLTDVYCYAESVPEINYAFVDEPKNATLHVPAASISAYKTAKQWKDFGTIVAISEIAPMEESVEVGFEGSITEDTDLTSTVVDNVYVTLDAEENDGYDKEEKCIVLASTVTEEQLEVIADKDVQDEAVKENFNGLIFEVPAGKGAISINVQTKGSRTLNVKIGDAEAQTFVQPERGDVKIPCTTTENTYVYIYGAATAAGAQRRVSGKETENGVLIYGIKWTQAESTDIDAVDTNDDGTYQIYMLDGTPVETLQKGVNIIKYKNGTSKKVVVK